MTATAGPRARIHVGDPTVRHLLGPDPLDERMERLATALDDQVVALDLHAAAIHRQVDQLDRLADALEHLDRLGDPYSQRRVVAAAVAYVWARIRRGGAR